jgi:RNA-binding protein 5/10
LIELDQLAFPITGAAATATSNGDSDVSPDNTASQFLLFRGLEPGVTEDLLAKGVAKLYRARSSPTPAPDPRLSKKLKASTATNDSTIGAREGSLRRVLLVRDRKTDDSWRYGFAEFGTVEDAQAAMTKFNNVEKFTISSKPVLVSYIHAGVFVPVLQDLGPEGDKFTFSPLSNPAVRLMYWDEAAYVTQLVTAHETESTEDERKRAAIEKAAAAAAHEGLVEKDGDAKAKKRKAEKEASSTNKKVVAPHLKFWSNRHAELHGFTPKEEDTSDVSGISEPTATASSKEELAPPSRSYADMNRKCCLLCSRQFKTEAEVNKHERMSQLHRDNLQKGDLVSKALTKLGTLGQSQAEADSAYRDRAKERRQAFNQPKQPAAQHNKPAKEVKPKSKDDETVSAPPPSKGAALLGKMGWTTGEGLGKEGTGITTAIQTDVYTQGVGLGAKGGKVGDAVEEAERQTKGGYGQFVDKTKERAKERFHSME